MTAEVTDSERTEHLLSGVNGETLRRRAAEMDARVTAEAALPPKVTNLESLDMWISEVLASLTEAELLRVKAKIDEITQSGPGASS